VNKAGTGYTLQAASGTLPAATSDAFNVTAAAPAGLDIVVQPTDTVVGQAINPAVTVDVVDAFGNIVTDSSAAVTLAIVSGPAGAEVGGTATVQAVQGAATFTDVTLNVAGSYVLKARSGTLTRVICNPITITPAMSGQT
jgi:hypothetical protein